LHRSNPHPKSVLAWPGGSGRTVRRHRLRRDRRPRTRWWPRRRA